MIKQPLCIYLCKRKTLIYILCYIHNKYAGIFCIPIFNL